MKTYDVSQVAVGASEEEPLILSGPPGRLSGQLKLHNTAATKARIAGLPLDLPDLRGPAAGPIAELPVTTRLLPGEQVDFRVGLGLDPTTPPGAYEGQLTLGDQRRAVKIHVTEHVDLQVAPTEVTIYTDGQLKIERTCTLENMGNVPLRLGPLCLAPLTDSMEVPSTLRAFLDGATGGEPPEVLRAFVDAWSEQRVGMLGLRRDDITLAPGEKRIEKGVFELPEDLKSHRLYTAEMKLYNARVTVEIYTGALGEQPEGSRKKKPAATKRKETRR